MPNQRVILQRKRLFLQSLLCTVCSNVLVSPTLAPATASIALKSTLTAKAVASTKTTPKTTNTKTDILKAIPFNLFLNQSNNPLFLEASHKSKSHSLPLRGTITDYNLIDKSGLAPNDRRPGLPSIKPSKFKGANLKVPKFRGEIKEPINQGTIKLASTQLRPLSGSLPPLTSKSSTVITPVLANTGFKTVPLPATQDSQTDAPDILDEDEKILFEADNISREQDDGPIIAEGNIRAFFGERYLTAEKIIFNPDTNIVIAEGQVSITDAEQNTVFANRVELSGDLRDGLAENFTALLDENAKIAADSAIREQGARTRLNKVVYTACDVCKEDGDEKTPTWRIKSLRVTRDEERKVIRFRHAFLELKGVPVLYTPFLQTPDPSVERQSGFLTPTIGTSSRISAFVEVPYYFALSNHQDFTFFPKFTVSDGVLWQGEYRRAFRKGQHAWAGGVIDFDQGPIDEDGLPIIAPGTAPEDIPEDAPGVRWYYFGRGFQNITNNLRVGYDIERVSDDTFLRRYDVFRRGDLRLEFDRSRTNRLRSNINSEWQSGGSKFNVDSYLFQGLRTSDDSSLTPFVLPLLNFRHDFRQKIAGGNLNVNANIAVLQRTRGTDSRRFTAQANWSREHITKSGHRFNAFAELRGDAFFFEDLDEGTEIVPNGFIPSPVGASPIGPTALNQEQDTTDLVGRFTPTAGVEWSYPLVKQKKNVRLLVEPRVQLVASLEDRNKDEIINEDSQSIEFDYTSLFDFNKSTGFDAIEDGQRVNVGLAGSATWANGVKLEAAIGQQYRLQNTDAFQLSTGLGENRSDLVGELNLDFGRKLTFQNRFRFDDNDGSFQRLESFLGYDFWRVNGNISYVRLEEENDIIGLNAEEELTATIRFALTRNWSIGGAWREDLNPGLVTARDSAGQLITNVDGSTAFFTNEGTIRQDFILGYQDECSSFDIIFRRNRTRDFGLEPDTSVLVQFTLRSLTSAGFGQRRR